MPVELPLALRVERSGGEGSGSQSLTTRNDMERAIETWRSTMAVKEGRISVNRTGSFVRFSFVFLDSFLH
jgi:hypothetical protein